ncbi:MAG: hypothetical protein ACYTG7_01430 [Planctomycetota bacterium]|jgi:hypothetical protein
MSKEHSFNIFSLLKDCTRSIPAHTHGDDQGNSLSVFDIGGMENLVREAVDNTLDELNIRLNSEDLEGLVFKVQVHFLKVLEDREQLDGSLKEMAVETVRLREKCQFNGGREAREPSVVKAEEPAASDSLPGEGCDIDGMVASRMDELLEALARGEALDSNAFRAVHTWLQEERERILEEAKSSQSGRIDILKRRIAKLSTRLNEAEERLAQAESLENPDSGMASEFRSAQGLDQGTDHYEAKKAVLEEIFNLNRELRELTACRANA